MSTSDRSEDDGIIVDPGLFTRFRSLAGWFFIATAIIGIAWAVLTWSE
jgi:hypothetical protein